MEENGQFIVNKANQLTNEVKRTGSISGLKSFYSGVKSNFVSILDCKDAESYNNIGSLFVIMLQDDNFEDDPDERQLMSAIGYYFICEGIKHATNNMAGPINREHVMNLLKVRILLMLYSKASMQFTLRLLPDREVNEYHSIFSSSQFREERNDLNNMVISDAIEIKEWAKSPSPNRLPIHNEATNLANQIIENNSNIVSKDNIDNISKEGKEIHKKLESFLYERFIANPFDENQITIE